MCIKHDMKCICNNLIINMYLAESNMQNVRSNCTKVKDE